MTTMKDKLSASVRQAKAGAEQEKPVPAKPAVAARKPAATKPAATKPAATKPAAAKPAAAKPAAAKATNKTEAKVYAGGITESNATLHPQRVWPD
jgi:hypothetical protein